MNEKRKVILYIAASLDGYIATEEDTLEWLFKVQGEGDNGYGAFYDTVDTIIIGRRTYDWIMEHEKGERPYKNKQIYVFSQSMRQYSDVEVVNEDVLSFTNKLKNVEGKNIWVVGGGELLHAFIEAKLIDEFRITVAPTIIGKGIPLFKKTDVETELQLKNIERYNQFVELHYVVR